MDMDLADDSLGDLEDHAVELAKLATGFDEEENLDAALYYYKECVSVLFWLVEKNSSLPELKQKAAVYLARAEELQEKIRERDEAKGLIETVTKQSDVNPEAESDLKRAKFMLIEAIKEDEEGDSEEAVDLYMEAVELCIKAKNGTDDEAIRGQLSRVAEKALTRAEELKAEISEKKTAERNGPKDDDLSAQFSAMNLPSVPKDDVPVAPKPVPSVTTPGCWSQQNSQTCTHDDNKPVRTRKGLIVLGPVSYSKEEIAVLKATSIINKREYVPFLSIDLKERFAYPVPYTDNEGMLALSGKQKERFAKWVRLDQLHPEPKIYHEIDPFSIKQTIVSDCSFLSSLMVTSLYEKKYRKRIISNIIYPQDKSGNPYYNPCGKYVVRLNVNGIRRKIIIDDYLPVDRHGGLLCSYSSKSDEFWVSILEKAYMEVMGGYDFPGSNSNIDLHSLTGWIPERISLKDKDFNAEKIFKLLRERHQRGDLLTTLATGELPDHVCDRTGLVSCHAYAVLDIRQAQGHRLLLVKNPWSHLRWKGKFSERDSINWTPALKSELKYEPANARNFDDGVFYIDFASVCMFFEAIYINWNPGIFTYTYCTHDVWRAGVGPLKDVYSVAHNPQYRLTPESDNCSIWVLLTRHITEVEDFAKNKEYIAVVVYKGGKKVYLPFDPPPLIDGARINSPHYLCKIIVPPADRTPFTLIVSQYEKTSTIFYSIRAYSTAKFVLEKIVDEFTYKEKVTGEWDDETAGGCGNNRDTYPMNPRYSLTLDGLNAEKNKLLIDLRGPRQYSVGFDLITVTTKDPQTPYYFKSMSSGPFRTGVTILEINPIPGGTYQIIPSTYHPNQKGPFFLEVQATCPLTLSRIR